MSPTGACYARSWLSEHEYAKRAGNFINNWNPNVTVPGRPDIKGMMQVRESAQNNARMSLITFVTATLCKRDFQLHRSASL